MIATRYNILLLTCLVPFFIQAAESENDTWPFEPKSDRFSDEAVLDLRDLNESEAGVHGFIQRSSDGMDFQRGDGEPIRFWTVLRRIDGKEALDDKQLRTFYRMLAKRGVNMVRLFGQLANNADGASLEAVDEEQIRRFHHHVAEARANGIYCTIAPYWSHSKAPASWNIEGLPDGGGAYGLLFTSERFRAAYRGWMRELLTRINPHTGRALKDEPAVAIIQMQNEDGLFWWQTQNLPDAQVAHLRSAFAAWAAEHYGSVEAALTAWGDATHQDDDPQAQVLGLHITWQLTQEASGDLSKRIADQIAFLAQYQRGIYAELDQFLRSDLGCPQLASACNWRTAEDDLLLDVERWTYAATDVIAINRYTGPAVFTGEATGWRITQGDRLVSLSVLREPTRLPIAVKQVAGHPFILTENQWVFPNRYQAEGPFLIAAYSSLTGVDSAYWSMAKTSNWDNDVAFGFTKNRPQPWIQRHQIMTPQILGQFPASALAFRRGDVARADAPAVVEQRQLQDLWQRRTAIIAEGRSFDPLQDQGDFAPASTIKHEIDPRAFLVGPVHVDFDGTGDSSSVDLDRYIQNERITSMTGEIILDAGTGIATVNSPRYQGACGFFAESTGSIELDSIRINSTSEYASIVAVSLDNQPLSESRSVLVQLGSVVRPSGWQEGAATVKPKNSDQEFAGTRVTATGRGPWQVTVVPGSLHIANPHLQRATLLDANGYRSDSATTEREDASLRVDLDVHSLYILLEE